jgi:hypothetical protein
MATTNRYRKLDLEMKRKAIALVNRVYQGHPKSQPSFRTLAYLDPCAPIDIRSN